ncbi:MAG: isoprenylcysteine carboxylmethyltransferase family protein [Clostridiales bacterium]|nr:isoprenylcysteine carboxylmethyltransferase family protein [Clostridiales bacterium]
MKKGKLLLSALVKFSLGVLLVGLLLFLPAGTINYPEAWLFMALLFIPMFIAGIFMLIKDPERLTKRLDGKEKLREQNTVIRMSALMFIVGFILAGLDKRFSWLPMPMWLCWLGAALFILSYLLYAEVLRENKWLSRKIEVQDGQKVIDSGLYGIVRHPMYMATLLLFCSMPLILGSLISFAVFLFYPAIIIKRLKSEEELLAKELEGYAEYMKKVRYRLIPYIW